MEIILGIAYGVSKIGLAFSESLLASPYAVLRVSSLEEAVQKVIKVLEKEHIERVVIGLPEGTMNQSVKIFKEKLATQCSIPIVFQDESLTTKMAQRLSIEAGLKRKKRRDNEDAYAATLILQEYLDSVV